MTAHQVSRIKKLKEPPQYDCFFIREGIKTEPMSLMINSSAINILLAKGQIHKNMKISIISCATRMHNTDATLEQHQLV
jgi:hypothetical protein